jgi:hypothetical protein
MSNSKMTEEDYHKNTSKYMVSERGRMPYDSRLVEETRVMIMFRKRRQYNM